MQMTDDKPDMSHLFAMFMEADPDEDQYILVDCVGVRFQDKEWVATIRVHKDTLEVDAAVVSFMYPYDTMTGVMTMIDGPERDAIAEAIIEHLKERDRIPSA